MKLLEKVPTSILKPLLAIIFMATWPFILIWSATRALFSKKHTDTQKVSIIKEVAIIIVLVGLIYFLYWISGSLSK